VCVCVCVRLCVCASMVGDRASVLASSEAGQPGLSNILLTNAACLQK
jgi:hypothetical protein